MSNFDTGDRLMSMAYEYYDELLRAYDRGSWNIVVRRSQEVVEVTLKGLLKIMGVEYPKNHDIGGVFSLVCMEMDLNVKPEELVALKEISSDLAKKRSPAFYMEEIYSKQDAEKAKADAEKVMNFAKALAEKLKTGL